ncbi:MAG: hypothetical protein C0483_17510 [Pirellula sp.]|nr:hypothetical protein [Pirellula sp.]
MTRWAIITGEYPPRPGGVADYTRLVAQALVAEGEAVRVYTSAETRAIQPDLDVPVVRLPDQFGIRGLAELDRQLRSVDRPERILIQYVPHAYGHKAMNVAFAAWVSARASKIAPVWSMFHEVAYPLEAGQSLRHRVLAKVNQAMARRIANASERVLVSIPAWSDTLQNLAPKAPGGEWLPVPSNIPGIADAETVSSIRARFGTGVKQIIGHFGSYGATTVNLLRPLAAQALRQLPNAAGLFIGRGSTEFRAEFGYKFPDLSERTHASGDVPATEIAEHISACDVLVQPYPDGVSCRRGSAMAGLALGRPIVTNRGFLSETIWESEDTGVTVTESAASDTLSQAIVELLQLSSQARLQLGALSADWYRRRFSIEHTVRGLTQRIPSAS